jgi:hypothetical protein
MAKFQSPLLGYNNNVRHKNRVFHIQTEDSGVNHPHIITHLFMDGGRILKSVKRSYAEHVGSDGMSELVRQMMKEQHKAMFIALRDGQFDHIVDPNAAAKPSTAPKPSSASSQTTEAVPVPAAPAVPAIGAPAAAAPAPGGAPPPTPRTSAPAVVSPPVAAAAPPPPPKPPPPQPKTARLVLVDPESEEMPSAAVAMGAATELTLDLDALERASREEPALFQSSDLPPPPKNLFSKEPGTGKYRSAEAISREDRTADRGPRPNVGAAAAPPPRAPIRPSSEGRYGAARPAAIFGAAQKAPQPPPSIFGDELISDKSLDEVILSYLAEDLEPPRRK